MRKKIFQKIFILFIIVFCFSLTEKGEAAFLTLKSSSSDIIGIGEEFYIDLLLDTEGESINGIEGNVVFPEEYVSFVRAEEGKSIINLWVEKPKLIYNNIGFAGVISNGFEGVIDPFNPKQKMPGLLLRLVFEAKKGGGAEFYTSSFSLNLNDGKGTPVVVYPISQVFQIGNFMREVKYKNTESESPILDAYVVKDESIYNNRYVLIFKAADKNVGIKSVMVKEGWRDWEEAESPYLLKDQSLRSDIAIQAVNYNGSGIITTIEGIPRDWKEIGISVMIIIIILLFLVFLKRTNNKKRV